MSGETGTKESGIDQMAAYDARIEIAAVSVLPWETGSPVSSHISAEGIRHD